MNRAIEAVGHMQDLAEDTLNRFRLMSDDREKLELAALTLRCIADFDMSELFIRSEVGHA